MASVADAMRAFSAFTTPERHSPASPFTCMCTLQPPADAEQIEVAWPGAQPPKDLAELWAVAAGAVLFEDIDYGQWGLRIFSPLDCAARTSKERLENPDEIGPGDFVLGEFLGDLETVVLAEQRQPTGVLIRLPLYPRSDWYRAAESLSLFLVNYCHHRGDKFWERTAAPS